MRLLSVAGVDLVGAGHAIRDLEGVDQPPVVYADADRPDDHGGWSGRPLLRPRTVTVTVRLVGAGLGREARTAAANVARQSLAAAVQPSSQLVAIVWDTPGVGERMIYVRGRRFADVTATGVPWVLDVVLELRADDPRIYETVRRTQTTGMVGRIGGFAFPLAWPVTFTTGPPVGDVGRVNCPNVGSWPTRPVLTITGPVDAGAVVENVTTGVSLRLAGGVAAGSKLVIDVDRRSVLADGVGDRRWLLDDRSGWPELVPGPNDVRFVGPRFDAGASLLVEWQSAWLV